MMTVEWVFSNVQRYDVGLSATIGGCMGVFSDYLARNSSDSQLFPNYEIIARLLLNQDRKLAREITNDVRRTLFSEFDDFFRSMWEQTLKIRLDSVRFERSGLASSSDLVQTLGTFNTVPLECAFLSSSGDGGEFGVVAPGATFQLTLDSALGFDVAELCRENAETNGVFFSGRTTPLERDLLKTLTNRLGRLCPYISDLNSWRTLWFAELEEKTRIPYNEMGYYWEQRSFDVAGNRFAWIAVFPASVLFEDHEADSFSSPVIFSENDKPSSVNIDSKANDVSSAVCSMNSEDVVSEYRPAASFCSKKVLDGTLNEVDEQGARTVDVIVDIGSGETSLERWKELRSGSILTTNLSANKLFTALFDGKPAYYVKPGLYRNAPAVQIKAKIDC